MLCFQKVYWITTYILGTVLTLHFLQFVYVKIILCHDKTITDLLIKEVATYCNRNTKGYERSFPHSADCITHLDVTAGTSYNSLALLISPSGASSPTTQCVQKSKCFCSSPPPSLSKFMTWMRTKSYNINKWNLNLHNAHGVNDQSGNLSITPVIIFTLSWISGNETKLINHSENNWEMLKVLRGVKSKLFKPHVTTNIRDGKQIIIILLL